MSRETSRPTRADVARAAGVSVATVSYVLNDTVALPESTRKRVLEAVARLDYRPNNAARSLATRRSMQLAIVVNNIANPIYADLILGFEHAALEAGYFVTICTGSARIDEYFDNFAARGIDGLFVEALPDRFHADHLSRVLDAGIPAVAFGPSAVDDSRLSVVRNEYAPAMTELVAHLRSLNHERICYVSGLSGPSDGRTDAFERAAAAAGIADAVSVVRPPQSTATAIADGRALARLALERDPRPTALICTNDLMAIGALKAAAELGIAVPEALSVAGIDNASVSELCVPRLTTLAADYRQTGSVACGLLLDLIRGKPPASYAAPLSLVVRESTATAARPPD